MDPIYIFASGLAYVGVTLTAVLMGVFLYALIRGTYQSMKADKERKDRGW